MAERVDALPHGIRSDMVNVVGLLANEWTYKMPAFQRPYSWTDQHVGPLIEDLRAATVYAHPYYFLGTIIVHTRERERFIIDGQQRLATLTLLLAYLRDRAADKAHAQALQRVIGVQERGVLAARMQLRRIDQEFFLEAVQTPGSFDALRERRDLRIGSQRLIRSAAREIGRSFDRLTAEEHYAVGRFLLSKITFNLIENDDLDSAAALFRAINYSGLRPGASTIIKSELLGRAGFSDEEAEDIAYQWDKLEEDLGEKNMSELWALIEVIVSGRAPSDKQNPRSFRAQVIDRIDVAQFLRTDMDRYLMTWRQVQRCKVDVGAASAEVNRRIAAMQLYRERGWLAPAVAMLADYRGDAEFCRRFFVGLDRITFGCVIGAFGGRGRGDRFAKVVRARDNADRLFGRDGALTLSASDTRDMIDKLNEPLSSDDNRAKIVAVRLDSIISGGKLLNPEEVTLEHVLPQADSAYWIGKFPDEERRFDYRYLIGNFVLLPEEQNRIAGNQDWDAKRAIYFKTKGVTPYAITADLEKYKTWDEAALRTRHQHMVDMLCKELEVV